MRWFLALFFLVASWVVFPIRTAFAGCTESYHSSYCVTKALGQCFVWGSTNVYTCSGCLAGETTTCMTATCDTHAEAAAYCTSANPTCQQLGGKCWKKPDVGFWPARWYDERRDGTPEGVSTNKCTGTVTGGVWTCSATQPLAYNEACPSDNWYSENCKMLVADVCESATNETDCNSSVVIRPWGMAQPCQWFPVGQPGPGTVDYTHTDGEHYKRPCTIGSFPECTANPPPPPVTSCVPDNGVCGNGILTDICGDWYGCTTSCPNNATCVSHTIPATMFTGQVLPVTVTMKNTGTANWTSSGGNPHKLGSQFPQDNSTWGLNRINLPATPVVPNSLAGFDFNLTAPNTPGTYSSVWQMVQEGLYWFGDYCGRTVNVNPPLCTFNTPPTAPDPVTLSVGETLALCANITKTPAGTPVASSNWTISGTPGIISLATGSVPNSHCNSITGQAAGNTTIDITVNLSPAGACSKTLIPVTVTAPIPVWWQVVGGDVYAASIVSRVAATIPVCSRYINLSN